MEHVDIFRQWSMESGHDEECGSATEGAGWAALFRGPFTPAEIARAGRDIGEPVPASIRNDIMRWKAAILYCDTAGFYSLDNFTSLEDAESHWSDVQSELDPIDPDE